MEEKRKHNRLELSGEIIIKPIGGAGEATAAQIEIHDCSRDGIGFTADAQLTIGNNYEANLTLWTNDTIHVFVQIVRAAKEGDVFHYGGIFIGMPEMDMKRIEIYDTVEQYSKKE